MKKRRLAQAACAVLYNCNFAGFAKGTIYKGNLKSVCVPGLNCYSCPGAVASCPLGSLQAALVSSKYKAPYYIVGLLLLFGALLGRAVCGFLCPFGLIQELLYKIPSRKLKKNAWTRRLSYLKYLVFLVFALAVPLVFFVPGFCKYVCPAGTLEGGLPLTAMDGRLRAMAGGLFLWKLFLLAVILLSAVFLFRSFCRILCPLGAFYGLFHKISLVKIQVDQEKCNGCNACIRCCRMDIRNVGDAECIQCGECAEWCGRDAIESMAFAQHARSCRQRR